MSDTKLDILFLSVPILDLQYPPSSAAILKACVKQAGYTARVLDTNIMLKDICGSNQVFDKVSNSFETMSKGPVTNNLVQSLFDNHTNQKEQVLYLEIQS